MPPTTQAPPVTPADLVDLLASDRVISSAKRLVDAHVRHLRAARMPNEDTSGNGQPRANALFHSHSDARVALDVIRAEIDRAAQRLAREIVDR